MSGLYYVLPTLLLIFISMLVVRAGATAFILTGMDPKRAIFQALSAFSGTGFTTREAESIVNHPTRRTIATWLMILGNAGIATVIVTGTSTLASSEGVGIPVSIVLLIVGIVLIYFIATRRGLITSWESFVQHRLAKTQVFEEKPVEELLRFLEGYGIVSTELEESSKLVGRSIADSPIAVPGYLVLVIERGREFIHAPGGQEVLRAGDRLVIYGRLLELEEQLDAVVVRAF